jgi:predicted phosphodiesterase
MRIAIISDIHGNLDAFESVLEDIAENHVDRLVCLGDCVGYGPEPEQVVAEVRRRQIETVMGNHELALIDESQLTWFNPNASHSLRQTRTMLSAASMAFIGQLPNTLTIAGGLFVHGYPPDSVRSYLFQKSNHEHKHVLDALEEAVCFVGHTHDLEIIDYHGERVERHSLKKGIKTLSSDHHYIINTGSVGQPRDGNNNAKYIIWEPEANRIDIRFVPYDIAAVVAKIEAAGLPEIHGRRLW